MKIINDKYYTPNNLAEYVVRKTKEIIGEENISEWLEPSGGNGIFLNYLPIGTYSCDIEPDDDRVKKQDYLTLDFQYKVGRCVVGNPPFGDRNMLAKKFFKKSLNLGDYISFILPITQLNNSQSLYEFELIYSEDLGEKQYSDRVVHCCFNIYKRPESGLNQKTDFTLTDVTLFEYKRGKEVNFDKYDFCICTWGNGSCGKYPEYKGQFAQEHYFLVNNLKLKDKVLEVCKNTDWKKDVAPSNTSSKKIQQFHIVDAVNKYLG